MQSGKGMEYGYELEIKVIKGCLVMSIIGGCGYAVMKVNGVIEMVGP